MQPYGGTEIQLDYLRKYVPNMFFDEVQITTSVPEKEPIHPMRPNILWIKNSYDQPNLAPWFKDPSNHSKYQWYVFNSHWNYEKYRYFFNIPTNQCTVIKNGVDYKELIPKTTFTFKPPIKLIYFSTPWRGLDVLLNVMEELKDPDFQLDVYSSTQIYGDSFKLQNDNNFVSLYKKADALPNVNYKGYLSHKELLKILPTYDINVHPSTWEETFCISAMESLAAGLLLITTDLGALPETCTEFPVYVPYTTDKTKLKDQFRDTLKDFKGIILKQNLADALQFQVEFYKRYYDWKNIGQFWQRFLIGAINDFRQKTKKTA